MTGGMRLMVPHAGENGRFFPCELQEPSQERH